MVVVLVGEIRDRYCAEPSEICDTGAAVDIGGGEGEGVVVVPGVDVNERYAPADVNERYAVVSVSDVKERYAVVEVTGGGAGKVVVAVLWTVNERNAEVVVVVAIVGGGVVVDCEVNERYAEAEALDTTGGVYVDCEVNETYAVAVVAGVVMGRVVVVVLWDVNERYAEGLVMVPVGIGVVVD